MKEKKEHVRNSSFYKFFKEHKKIRICTITVGAIASTFLIVNLGRYVKDVIYNYFVMTQEFYFNSTKLKENNASYSIDYWNGTTDPYTISIDVNSLDNSLKAARKDIDYKITCTTSSDVDCYMSGTSNTVNGTLLATEEDHTNNHTVTIVPHRTFENVGDKVTVTVTAESTSPFKKTLSANFTLIVGKYGITYSIEDEETQPYLTSTITESQSTCTVTENFGTYRVGDTLSAGAYAGLSAADRKKCVSATITLSFDASKYRLDTTSAIYKSATNVRTQTIDGYNYVNRITFVIGPESSLAIKFYKLNPSVDNSYPIVTNSPVIVMTAE
jgi:hypothetical protein